MIAVHFGTTMWEKGMHACTCRCKCTRALRSNWPSRRDSKEAIAAASTGTGREEERKIGEVDRALVSHFLFEILSHIHTAGKDLTPVSAFTVEFCKYYPFE